MKKTWWKEAVVYQIYPRSFYDSNGDGIGDLKGIEQKLDYIQDLGVDVIWLCPIYKSPNHDSGYDISDYFDIIQDFGNVVDIEKLIDEIHRRNMKIIMDLVVNHTSDQHPWFIESRSSKDNPKRDYYIWREGEKDKKPNNWRSYFSSSVWEYDEKTREYYLHLFSKNQPDLNWRNDKVRYEIFEMIKFWLDKGIDGFRMDTINMILKASGLPDSKKTPTTTDGYVFDEDMYCNQEGIHTLLKDMNQQVLSKYNVMTVGETLNVAPDIATLYVDEHRQELNMLCHFELMHIDAGSRWKWDVVPWKVKDFKRIITKWQVQLYKKGWMSLYLNNHDQPRVVSRFGNDSVYREQSAKMLATLLYTLCGTPFIYQGEEIGMTNVKFTNIEDYRDVETLNFYHEAINKEGWDVNKVMESIYAKGRDNVRTPMQWNSSKNAGFSCGEPWIKVNPNYAQINVEQSLSDSYSILNYYKRLINLRKQNAVMIYGNYTLLLEEHEQIFCYMRSLKNEKLLIILNFSSECPTLFLPDDINLISKNLLLSNYEIEQKEKLNNIILRPYEARIYKWIE